ncbi:MAG: glycosyltransferase family 4 protein [Oscillibacter sp.]|nr:glycosyltransferase family 4 protein [Oscillibacter sp.]
MIKVLYVFTSCKKSGPIQQMLNLIKNLDREVFSPSLLTVYPEDESGLSVLEQYLPYVEHKLIRMSKKDMLFGACGEFRRYVRELKPDVIHTLGVFPDYLVERLGYPNHTFTCRNFVYDDYPDEYGKLMGTALAKIHLRAIRSCRYVRCCSESLHRIYRERLGLEIPFIRNGVDVSKFRVPTAEEKRACREKLGIPQGKTVWVYGGVFNGRKNQAFLLDAVRGCRHFADSCLVLPGDGEQYAALKAEYGADERVLMPGNVLNMNEYLMASDLYVSTSKSEGMPNGVLEAMATGLPVLLSDIDQHTELLRASDLPFGSVYRRDERADFCEQFDRLFETQNEAMRENAATVARDLFSAERMSRNYQDLYGRIGQETADYGV